MRNRVKERLRSGKPNIGLLVATGHPDLAEIYAWSRHERDRASSFAHEGLPNVLGRVSWSGDDAAQLRDGYLNTNVSRAVR